MDRDQKIKIVAAACHEANRAYCIGIGDSSQKPWAEAEGWQRDASVESVKFALTNPTPGAHHESWREKKIHDGWVHGPVKDGNAKPPTHPDLVPFSDLPRFAQIKDEIFLSTVKAVSAEIGLA